MYYEVYIPSNDSDGYDVTITVDAENWMSALKSGLERTGEGAETVRNVMCDIKDDNSIHVTDATTQRVFVLEELGEEPPDDVRVGEPEKEEGKPESLVEDGESDEAPGSSVQSGESAVSGSASVEPKEPEESPEPAAGSVQTPESTHEAGPTEPIEVLDESKEKGEPGGVQVPDDQTRTTTPETPQAGGADQSAQPPPEPDEGRDQAPAGDSFTRDEQEMDIGSQRQSALQNETPEAEVVDEHRERSDVHRAADVGRQDETVSESLIEDVFLEIQPIHEGDKGMEEVVNFVMDLAMEKIKAESGSILFADTSGTELYFAAARGPKANEVMDFRVPMGEGIVGFCSKEGVSLAVGDAQNDPRFYKEISESLGYETDSLLCAPVQYEGRVYGAIELINRVDGSSFTSDEMNALAYIGRQLAEYVNRTLMQQESLEE